MARLAREADRRHEARKCAHEGHPPAARLWQLGDALTPDRLICARCWATLGRRRHRPERERGDEMLTDQPGEAAGQAIIRAAILLEALTHRATAPTLEEVARALAVVLAAVRRYRESDPIGSGP